MEKSYDKTTIGDEIRAARKAKGWTQTVLGDKLNVSFTTVAAWEQGKSNPRIPTLVLLSKALQTDFGVPDILFGGLDIEAERAAEPCKIDRDRISDQTKKAMGGIEILRAGFQSSEDPFSNALSFQLGFIKTYLRNILNELEK